MPKLFIVSPSLTPPKELMLNYLRKVAHENQQSACGFVIGDYTPVALFHYDKPGIHCALIDCGLHRYGICLVDARTSKQQHYFLAQEGVIIPDFLIVPSRRISVVLNFADSERGGVIQEGVLLCQALNVFLQTIKRGTVPDIIRIGSFSEEDVRRYLCNAVLTFPEENVLWCLDSSLGLNSESLRGEAVFLLNKPHLLSVLAEERFRLLLRDENGGFEVFEKIECCKEDASKNRLEKWLAVKLNLFNIAQKKEILDLMAQCLTYSFTTIQWKEAWGRCVGELKNAFRDPRKFDFESAQSVIDLWLVKEWLAACANLTGIQSAVLSRLSEVIHRKMDLHEAWMDATMTLKDTPLALFEGVDSRPAKAEHLSAAQSTGENYEKLMTVIKTHPSAEGRLASVVYSAKMRLLQDCVAFAERAFKQNKLDNAVRYLSRAVQVLGTTAPSAVIYFGAPVVAATTSGDASSSERKESVSEQVYMPLPLEYRYLTQALSLLRRKSGLNERTGLIEEIVPQIEQIFGPSDRTNWLSCVAAGYCPEFFLKRPPDVSQTLMMLLRKVVLQEVLNALMSNSLNFCELDAVIKNELLTFTAQMKGHVTRTQGLGTLKVPLQSDIRGVMTKTDDIDTQRENLAIQLGAAKKNHRMHEEQLQDLFCCIAILYYKSNGDSGLLNRVKGLLSGYTGMGEYVKSACAYTNRSDSIFALFGTFEPIVLETGECLMTFVKKNSMLSYVELLQLLILRLSKEDLEAYVVPVLLTSERGSLDERGKPLIAGINVNEAKAALTAAPFVFDLANRYFNTSTLYYADYGARALFELAAEVKVLRWHIAYNLLEALIRTINEVDRDHPLITGLQEKEICEISPGVGCVIFFKDGQISREVYGNNMIAAVDLFLGHSKSSQKFKDKLQALILESNWSKLDQRLQLRIEAGKLTIPLIGLATAFGDERLLPPSDFRPKSILPMPSATISVASKSIPDSKDLETLKAEAAVLVAKKSILHLWGSVWGEIQQIQECERKLLEIKKFNEEQGPVSFTSGERFSKRFLSGNIATMNPIRAALHLMYSGAEPTEPVSTKLVEEQIEDCKKNIEKLIIKLNQRLVSLRKTELFDSVTLWSGTRTGMAAGVVLQGVGVKRRFVSLSLDEMSAELRKLDGLIEALKLEFPEKAVDSSSGCYQGVLALKDWFLRMFCCSASAAALSPSRTLQPPVSATPFMESSRIDNYLAGQQLQRTSIPKDGNCFFACIAHIVNQRDRSSVSHEEVRAQGIQYMRDNESRFSVRLGTGQAFESYLANMSRGGVFAEDEIVEAVVAKYGLQLQIHDLREGHSRSVIRMPVGSTGPFVELLQSGRPPSEHYDVLSAQSTAGYHPLEVGS